MAITDVEGGNAQVVFSPSNASGLESQLARIGERLPGF